MVTKSGNPETLEPSATMGALAANEDDRKVSSPQFRHNLNVRMGIYDTSDKSESGKIKRDRRQWVLEECLKRGMDLRTKFQSYPYPTKMYPAIKSITSFAPKDWCWDRKTTEDVIRTLCWDRVRTMNRRAAKSLKLRQKKPGTALTSPPEDDAGNTRSLFGNGNIQLQPKLSKITTKNSTPVKKLPRSNAQSLSRPHPMDAASSSLLYLWL